MRCCRLSCCGWAVLTLAIAGCGAAPQDGANMSSQTEMVLEAEPDVDTAPPTATADLDLMTSDVEFEAPEMAAAEPAMDMQAPGGLDSGELAMSMSAPNAAPASTADDWPVITRRHMPLQTRSTAAAASSAPRAPTTSVEHVDEIVSRLDYGTVGFYTPEELPWGETFIQEVVLSPKDTPEELRAALSQPTAPAEFSRLQVANRMEAKLTGSGFEIEPLSEALQAITSHRPTKWRFKVTPHEHGPQELHLSLLAHIDVDGRDSALVVETKDALIEVDITVPQRLAGMFQAHWKWLWAAVIVPAIGYFWRRRTDHRPREQPLRHARAA